MDIRLPRRFRCFLAALGLLASAGASPAAERPYVAIYKTAAGMYAAGIKAGSSFEGVEAVEAVGARQEVVPGLTEPGRSTTVYEFQSIEGDLHFFAALPPGLAPYAADEASHGGEQAVEAFANGLSYFATMYSPVLRIEEAGRPVSACTFIRQRAEGLSALVPGCQAGTADCMEPVIPVQGVGLPSREPPSLPEHLQGISREDFDAQGILEDAWFAAHRDRLRPVTVLNSPCAPDIHRFEDAPPGGPSGMGRYRFRSHGEVYALSPPDELVGTGTVLVITGQSLTPAQQEYLARGFLGRLGVKTGEAAGRIWSWGRSTVGDLLGQ
jgi:hypothetical protein